ncbi:MAG: ribonuclease HI family protein [Candidatus Thermoplasmatota archaeon]
MKATVWFDGACLGNPGPMGAGAVVETGDKRQELSKGMGRGTNNEAEYHGLLLGLRHALAAGVDEVTVRGDSQLVLRQVEGRYAVRAPGLQPLHAEAVALLKRFRTVKLEWIPRAANADADRLASAAAASR